MDCARNGITQSARNLLLHCAGLQQGQRVLIVTEDASEGHYDPTLGPMIAAAARQMGLRPTLWQVPFVEQVNGIEPELARIMARVDCTIFLARLGDQIRFLDYARDRRAVVVSALDHEMFGSAYGWAHHAAFRGIKAALNRAMARAATITVTCPLGTAFCGQGPDMLATEPADVAVHRFPMSVFAPVPACGFAGQLAQRGFLTGTCSKFYKPYAAPLEDVLLILFEGNRITGFDGSPRDVATAKAHYHMVGERFGIDPDFVHSWHIGIHPGCAYPQPAARNYERWCSGAFGNPRLLHFHTCGAYAPGEISVNIVDPTVVVDGVAIWEAGVLHPERLPEGPEILATYPCAQYAFDHPAQAIGL